ncbi:phosphotransferase [Halomicrobium mukohataei]|uniref:Phosphotransferase n=1 Tax=Halomicrobium mukohataei TaxID=57705 RepID=A0A847TT14_9EURY|nr:fructosamine kinase family protein [Halomicrobium mukohataei]NLV09182.1 phosphotransferase [Halomicrobium mukohataei]
MTSAPTAAVEATLGGSVETVERLDGGMVGDVFRVELADGRVTVAKTGEHDLSTEGRMLSSLAAESDLPVPEVYHSDADLLCIEYVEGESTITPAVERDAARQLADLHRVEGRAFGFPFDTLTGPVPQPNPWTERWIPFYRDQRVRSICDRASQAGTLSDELAARVERACADFESLLTEPEAPALLHGDAWRTNLLTDGQRVTAFLDPACYYGHPEIELAYVDWTETFGDAFFERYRRERGVELAGFFDRRRFVYRLYPLLVHVHLFGGQYRAELAETLGCLGY